MQHETSNASLKHQANIVRSTSKQYASVPSRTEDEDAFGGVDAVVAVSPVFLDVMMR